MVRNSSEKESKYIDIHTHKYYNDNNIFFIYNKLLKELEDKEFTKVKYFSVGCHPWFADNYFKYKNLISQNCQLTECIAIGEIGLDRTKGEFSLQEKVFEEQLNLAHNFKKTVIIHSVRAYDRLLYFYKKYNSVKWIIHGYNGSFEQAQQLINKGIYLSIGTDILYSNRKITKVLPLLPLDFIFFETDTLNVNIKDIYKKAAELLKIDLQKLKNQIQQNFKTVFYGYVV